ncbi:hypothetical protein [Kribbella ginsengisoli]|uniref:hypothetical protein n=1 Tax=Kribbella ginsengisoli TaxID=363865 RepID=UPI0031CFE563
MAEESGPRPGHFLPQGDQPASTSTYRRPPVPAYGDPSEPLAPPARPLLTGSRLGPPPPGDRAAAAFKARYNPDPVAFAPRKRSKAIVAAVVAGAVILVAGGAFAATLVLS